MNEFGQIKDEIMVQVIGASNHRVRPHEVEKSLSKRLGVSAFTVREAVKDLVEEGELTFTYRDPCSYVEIPPIEPHHAARPMEVVVDADGERWICDSGVDRSQDLAAQGCWSCGDLAFTRND